MNETAFQVGDMFVDTLWAEDNSCQIIAIEADRFTALYEVKWADGEITYERADYLRQLDKI